MKANDFYSEPVGWGSYTPLKIQRLFTDMRTATQVDGRWITARPEPYYSLIERLRQAWDVLRYRADALYWKEK